MELKPFHLHIITPSRTEHIEIEWIEVESPTGNFFVGPDHSPLISIIKHHATLAYKPIHAEPVNLKVSQGVFKISDNQALVLLDQ